MISDLKKKKFKENLCSGFYSWSQWEQDTQFNLNETQI